MAGLQGRIFGGYQLVEQIPGGGIADVYRGRPTKAGGRDVVVKVIYPEFAHQPGFLPHFRQIVANSDKLASHPHVLPLIASGEDSGYLYLVTPYVEAGTLRDWLRKGGRMGVGDAAPFFRQLCDALTYAHSLGVVHGNLKPSNIFLYEGRHVLVSDFGMLWDVSHMDMNHAGSGTEAVEFLAPEVLSGRVTQLSDIYSAGALLFAALTGHAPFQAATPAAVFAAATHQPVPHLAQANPALPASTQALDVVIQKAMAARPEDRFPSAAAVAQSIETSARQAASATGPAFSAGAGAPFVPVSGLTPFGSMPLSPQGGPATPAAPGVPGAFPVPAISLAQAAAAIASGAVPSLGQLAPPFPPLPSTAKPESQMEQARIGGINGAGMQPAVHPLAPLAGNSPASGIPFSESTVHVPAPAIADVPFQPTMHVPAPAPVLPDASPQPAMRVPAPIPAPALPATPNASQQPGTALDAPPGFGAPPEPRPVRISGAPRAKLGRAPAAPFPTLNDDEEDFAPPISMPAVRPSAGQSGFAVAGGIGSFDPGARGMSPQQSDGFPRDALPGGAALDASMGMSDAALPDYTGYATSSDINGYDERYGASAEYSGFAESTGQAWGGEAHANVSDAQGGWRDGYTGEQPGYSEQPGSQGNGTRWGEYSAEHTDEYGGHQAGGYTGEYGAPYTGEYTGAQAASGYSGDLGSQYQGDAGGDGRPFSATQLGLPRLTSPALVDRPPSWQEILSDSGGPPSEMVAGMPGARSAPGERAPTWEDAGESMWQMAVQPPTHQESRLPQHIEAEWMGNGVAGAGSQGASAEPSGKRKKKGKQAWQEPEDSGFDDDRVWTTGTTAIRPRRWPRKLALLLLLVILIDLGALVMLRPDLCPTSGCRALSATLRHQLGLTQSASAPTPLTTTPTSVTLTVASGKSASASLTVQNATSGNITWKASAGLTWISMNPTSGSLAANHATALVLTAKPTNIKAGTYTTNITFTLTGASSQTVTIPVTIHVTA